MKKHSNLAIHDSGVEKKGAISFTSGTIRSDAPFHRLLPFVRRVFVDENLFPHCKVHIAVHYVKNAETIDTHYTELHSHDVDEINLVLEKQNKSSLTYRIRTSSEEFTVKSPQAIYIPQGTPHAAEAIRGSGIFVCILLKGSLY